ncbi:MAG: lamin tail domain-containing protein [Sandaracinaceae bacterium]|nr:lamin tail domain-containing protein [Sandaracinaceae bacterium]
MRAWLAVIAALFSFGCALGGFDDAGTSAPDAAAMDAGRMDAGRMDAGRSDAGGGGDDAGPPPMDAGPGMVDAGPMMMVDAGPMMMVDAGPMMMVDSGGATTCSPTPANMEISEILVASQTGAADRGEWFEVHNRAGCTIDLSGLVIDVDGTTHTVTSGLLTAGGFFVFAQSSSAADNHGLSQDYVYGSTIRFGNSSGTLVLTHAGTEIARLTWTSTDHRTGRSRQLSNGASMPTSLAGSGWCDSTDVYSTALGGPYLGTPGMVNATCP